MNKKKRLFCTAILCTLAIAVLQGGCVERKLTINTNPQGAMVFLNDEQIGTSPVLVAFNWYGDYRIQAVKPGYDILNTHKKLKRPLHDCFPFDFAAEILWPGKIIDEYEWTFELSEYQPPQRQELIDAALQMKTMAGIEVPETAADPNIK